MILNFSIINKQKGTIIVALVTILIASYLSWENFNDYFYTVKAHHEKYTNNVTLVAQFLEKVDPEYEIFIPNPPMHYPWVFLLMPDISRNVKYPTIEDAISVIEKNKALKPMIILVEYNADKLKLFTAADPDLNEKSINGNKDLKVLVID